MWSERTQQKLVIKGPAEEHPAAWLVRRREVEDLMTGLVRFGRFCYGCASSCQSEA